MRRSLLTGKSMDLTPYSMIAGLSKLRRSTDIVNWTQPSALSIQAKQVRSIAYSPSLNLHVAVGDGGYIGTSADGGVTWFDRSVDAVFTNYEVMWVAELALFVYVGGNSGTKTIKTSPDGVTWTERTTAGTTELYSVTWSSTLGLAVAVGQNGSLYTSTNLTGWTNGTGNAGSVTLRSVAWSAAAGVFCTVGDTAACYTSFTGTSSWTSRTISSGGSLTVVAAWDVVQSGGGFLAGNSAGSLWSSAAGASWTSRTSNAGGAIRKIAMSAQQSLGILLADNGVICNSSNGFTWTLRQTYSEDLTALLGR